MTISINQYPVNDNGIDQANVPDTQTEQQYPQVISLDMKFNIKFSCLENQPLNPIKISEEVII
jgi:hypothetical protein